VGDYESPLQCIHVFVLAIANRPYRIYRRKNGIITAAVLLLSLFQLFFTTQIPAGLRFSTFSPQHFFLIAAALVCVWMLARRFGVPGNYSAPKTFALALPCVYFFKFAVFTLLELFVEPQMTLADRLPLHLCAINAAVMPLAVYKKNTLLLNFIYAVSLPAALFAMLTPAMSYYGLYFFLSWQVLFFYIDHGLMALVAILALKTGLARPDPRLYPRVIGLLASYAAVIYAVDKIFDENFLFLNYPDEGTVMAFFAEYLGNPGYLAPLVALAALVVLLMYAPFFCRRLSPKNN
jgi:hypothetical integral membrane protein (TIGR02206 family)